MHIGLSKTEHRWLEGTLELSRTIVQVIQTIQGEIKALTRAYKEIKQQMAKTQAEFDAALQSVENSVQQLGRDMQQAFNDIKSRIPPGTDLQDEFDRASALSTALANFDAEAQSQFNPPTPPTPGSGSESAPASGPEQVPPTSKT